MVSETVLDLRKCPNQKTHERESAVFLVWALPKVKAVFYTKSYIITILNFFPIVFKKCDLTMVGSLFRQKKILKKPNNPKNA